MGQSKTPAELALKLSRAGQGISDAAKVGVSRSALIVKASVLRQINSIASSGRLRGVGKRGAKLSVSYIVKGGVNPSALVRAKGPLHLLESNTKPHDIPTEGAKRKFVVIGTEVRSRVHHPGTKGKHPWEKGVAEAIPLTRAAFSTGLSEGLRKIF